MEFLVEFEVHVPAGTPQSDVRDREAAESTAAAKLADEGHLVRLWRRPRLGDGATAVGLYRADSEAHLDALLSDLPLGDWLRVTVTPLESHPNDPPGGTSTANRLPDPRLTRVFRLEATLGETTRSRRHGSWPPAHRPADRRRVRRSRAQREAAPGRERRLADRPRRRHHARRSPLHAADRRRRSDLRPVARCASRPRRGPGASRARRGRRRS